MSNIVRVEARALLDASNGVAAYTAPTAPIQIALVTVVGSTTAAGTEVAGGSYARQNVTWGAASSTDPPVATNSNQLTYVNMPATTVVGVAEWDSAAVAVRRWFAGLVANKTTNAGDSFSIAPGALTKQLG